MIAFNHRAVLNRPAETNTTGDPMIAWSQPGSPSGLNAWPDQSWSGLLAGSPLGEVQAATLLWFLDAGFEHIQERDVLDVTQGPLSPRKFRVHSVSKPTGRSGTIHHIEVATKIYEGTLS